MMNSENAPKEIVQSFVDLMNMAKWLMDETLQPSVTQELGRLFSSIKVEGGEVKAVSFLELVLADDTNNTNFATRSTTKRTIEKIWGSKATSKKP